jgi:hypothetical protein
MIKGYKVFNPDFTCRGFQYEVGKTYEHSGPISICSKGFHFCRAAADCFGYYPFNPNNKVAEVIAHGLVESDDTKSVTDKIEIVREIPWSEVLEIVNTGKACTGLRNTGNRNTGSYNTGSYNTGNRNTGNCNTGSYNTGNRNTGSCNTGNRNTGNCNTGDWNTGDWNTGDWNTGFFSTITPKIDLFEKPTNMTAEEVKNLKGMQILYWNYENNWWIYSKNMTEAEKKAHPEHETLGGYLKSVPFKDACKIMWGKLTEDEKSEVKKLPNFDADIFERITGIKA